MTQAQAATVVQALASAGYKFELFNTDPTTYKIRVVGYNIGQTPVSAQTVATFASNQGVTATVLGVEFS